MNRRKLIEHTKLLLLLCVGFLCTACPPDPVEPGSVNGKVTDSRTGEPLQGVTVSISPGELRSRTTGSDGYYEFTNLSNGNYTVQGVKENYRTNTKSVVVFTGQNTPCDFQLTPSAARLEVSQLSVDFGNEITTHTLNVINSGDAALHWSASEDTPWLVCMPSTGEVAAGNKQAVTLNVDRSGMSRGSYTATISFTSTDGGGANVVVKMSVQGIAVSVSPEELDFGTATTTLQLTMTGGDNVNYTLIPSNSWILPSKTSGTFSKTENLTVAVNRTGLAEGNYNGSLSLRVGEHSMDIPVRMSIIPKVAPTVSLLGVEGITDGSALFRGAVLSVGSSRVVRYGFCWSSQGEPEVSTAESCNFGDASEPKEMTYTASALTANTIYYVRAYAENTEGISYSPVMKFTTAETPQKPVVETGAVSLIQATQATASGNLLKTGVDIGVTTHGHVWSTHAAPTVNDMKSSLGARADAGAFSSTLTGLSPNTTYYVRAYATNTIGTAYGEEVTFTTIPDVIKLTTASPADITHSSATLGGVITADGGNSITECGVCWATTQNPTVAASHQAATRTGNSFSVRVETLSERTLYHVRAYAVAANGTVYYGNDVQLQTTHQIHLPQASGVSVSQVKVTGATLRASVTNDGDGNISDAGFVYATTPNPSVANNKVSCGVQTDAYSSTLQNLQENTIYYVRAYVTNEAGTNYGEETSFTTLEIKQAALSAVTLTAFSHKSATFSAKVEQLNNGTLTEVGFVYSTSPEPGLTNHKVACGTDTSFSGRTTSLTANTTYYVRAYATNEKGTTFSPQLTFTTKPEPDDSSFDTGDFGEDEKWD